MLLSFELLNFVNQFLLLKADFEVTNLKVQFSISRKKVLFLKYT